MYLNLTHDFVKDVDFARMDQEYVVDLIRRISLAWGSPNPWLISMSIQQRIIEFIVE